MRKALNLKCWTCKMTVQNPMIVATHEGAAMDSRDMAVDFRPIVWRLTHRDEDCIPVAKNDVLTTAMPQTPQAWITLTIRLLDQKGEYFLFRISNFRYVLDCAQDNDGDGYYAGINNYVNPVQVTKKYEDPETIEPRPVRVRAPKIKPPPRANKSAAPRIVVGVVNRRRPK